MSPSSPCVKLISSRAERVAHIVCSSDSSLPLTCQRTFHVVFGDPLGEIPGCEDYACRVSYSSARLLVLGSTFTSCRIVALIVPSVIRASWQTFHTEDKVSKYSTNFCSVIIHVYLYAYTYLTLVNQLETL